MASLGPGLRPARADDAPVLAQLINLAGEGIPSYLWRAAAPDVDPLETGAQRAARDEGGFSYRNAHVIEARGAVAGMLLGYRQPDPYDTGPLDDLPAIVRPLVELEALASDSWYVNAVAVFPDHQGQGLGARLMALAERLAADTGAPDLSLIAAEENAGAVRLYRRLGYDDVDRRPVVSFPGLAHGGDWLLMVKPLTAA